MVIFPLNMVIFPLNMVIFPLNMVIFPLKIVIFPLKMSNYQRVFGASYEAPFEFGYFPTVLVLVKGGRYWGQCWQALANQNHRQIERCGPLVS